MDTNKIFELFLLPEEEINDVEIDISLYKISRFIKDISLSKNYYNYIISILKPENESELQPIIYNYLYNRFFFYLNDLNIKDIAFSDIEEKIDLNNFFFSLEILRVFYEKNEDYEKCVILRDFQEELKKFGFPKNS
jgi:hypothetical protein